MIVQNSMEEKQLDFNRPLLSVRRFSSTVASEMDNKRKDSSLARLPPIPVYKSELKSGPVRNPGTVPFVWEQTPGRPKDEKKLYTSVVEQSPITPDLPPGRVLKYKREDTEKVPKPKPATQSRIESTVPNSQSVTSVNKDVTKCESPKEAMQDKASSVSDDADEAYQDALDTLSRTESFFMNCSVSGLSGLDDLDVHLPRSFSMDQHARDFMIDRFLPAAQAVVTETPQYASRKPPVVREQPRSVRKVMTGERRRPINQHRPIILPPYAQDFGWEESEDESEVYSESENYTAKVCGLFPRFCLLNPIPGLRMQDRVPSSPAYGMQAKSSAFHGQTAKENARTYFEKKSANPQSGIAEEKHFLGIPEKSKSGIEQHRRGCSTLSSTGSTKCDNGCESPVVEKTLYVDSVQKVKSHVSSNSPEAKIQTFHKRDEFETFRKDNKLLGVVDEKAALQPKEKQGLANSGGYQGSFVDQNSNLKVAECSEVDSFCNQESFHDRIKNSSVSCQKFDSRRQQSEKSVHQGLHHDPSTRVSPPKVVGDGKIDLENQFLMKLSNQENSDTKNFQLPLALPSPKAPSESWLKRTLPTVSSRNTSSSRPYPASQIHAREQSPKWETIVKSSNGHLRFAEELLAPIPEA